MAFTRGVGTALLLGAVAAGSGTGAQPEEPARGSTEELVYLYSFFREPNGAGGLQLAYSEDFFRWQEIEGPHFRPTIGDQTGEGEEGQRVFRDPFVAPDPDGGFQMVWTTGWGRRDIGYAHSPDLIHWEGERLLPVMAHREAAQNCWAPKLFYDRKERHWMILWSTTLADRTFPDPTVPGTSRNHRIWYVTTRDFETLTEPRVLFDPGHSCIDAYILREGSRHCLFFKDERANDDAVAAFDARYQNIRMACGAGPQGPFGDISPPITGQGAGPWKNEGPSAIQVGNQHYVFYDHHGDEPYFGVVRSRDLVSWEDVTARFTFPERSKHGHVFRVARRVVRRLISPP